MIEIARSSELTGVLQKDISINQNISLKYLGHIISNLKQHGLIVTIKGKGSGYKLTRKADEITIWDIYTAFEPIVMVDCLKHEGICERSCHCEARLYWSELKREFEEILLKKSLAQVMNKTVI